MRKLVEGEFREHLLPSPLRLVVVSNTQLSTGLRRFGALLVKVSLVLATPADPLSSIVPPRDAPSSPLGGTVAYRVKQDPTPRDDPDPQIHSKETALHLLRPSSPQYHSPHAPRSRAPLRRLASYDVPARYVPLRL